MNKKVQFKINRLKSLFIILLGLFVGLNDVGANEAFQTKLQKKISLNFENVSLRKLLDEIQKQSKIGFVYKYEKELESFTLKSISLLNVTVEEALNQVFRNMPFSYKVVNDAVTIIKRDEPQSKIPLKIKGKIVASDTRTPIVGATILIAGKQGGVISDDQGNFILQVRQGDVLEIRYLGMKPIIYSKNYIENKEIFLEMYPEAINMDDVVVTGYQDIDKRKNTSSIQTLKMDDIKIPGVQTLDRMLEGQVPGMIFMQNSGQVGATPKLRVRGTSTILGNQEPLWVLDGIVLQDPVNVNPQLSNDLDFVNLVGNAISGINPEDIERIDILKDASATALYGAKAATG